MVSCTIREAAMDLLHALSPFLPADLALVPVARPLFVVLLFECGQCKAAADATT